jgi:hypothetical protein
VQKVKTGVEERLGRERRVGGEGEYRGRRSGVAPVQEVKTGAVNTGVQCIVRTPYLCRR